MLPQPTPACLPVASAITLRRARVVEGQSRLSFILYLAAPLMVKGRGERLTVRQRGVCNGRYLAYYSEDYQ